VNKHPYFRDTPNSLLTHCRISRQYNAIQYNKNICNTGENRRAESQPLYRKKHLDSFIRFDTTPFSERQKCRHGQTIAEQPMANTPLTKRSTGMQLLVHKNATVQKKRKLILLRVSDRLAKRLASSDCSAHLLMTSQPHFAHSLQQVRGFARSSHRFLRLRLVMGVPSIPMASRYGWRAGLCCLACDWGRIYAT